MIDLKALLSAGNSGALPLSPIADLSEQIAIQFQQKFEV